jgi:PAS domain S-box-containing protein
MPVVFVAASTPSHASYVDALTRGGLHIHTAASIEEAMRVCDQVSPDLIIVVDGPALDAADVCRRLKSTPGCGGSGVVLVGPGDDEARHRLGLEAGADACLPGNAGSGTVTVQALAVLRGRETSGRAHQNRLRESEERLRLAVDATGVGVFDFDPQSGQLVWSAMAKRHFGLPPNADVGFETFLRGLHPADRDRVEQLVRSALRPESGGEYATDYRTVGLEDGQERWLLARGRVSFDVDGRPVRFVGVTQDITAGKRFEAQTRLAQARYATLVSVVREGFAHYRAVHDAGGTLVDLLVLEVNPAGARLSGMAPEAQIGRRWREIWPAVDESVLDVYRQVERTGDTAHFDYDDPSTGRSHDIAVSLISPGEFAVSFYDITERKAAEGALRQANEELRESGRRKDEFIAILSHELRNPLAPIRMALPLLGRERLGEQGARAAGVIERQVNHLTRLLDDLLDVSRISRGKLDIRPQRTTLGSIVKAALEAASPLVMAGRHDLRLRIPSDPIWIRADLARLTQVVTNLVNNSAACTPPGGLIEVQAGREEGRATVRIRDNGIGIPPQALPDLFEMFRQVKRADQPQGGLGIGLALSRRLIEMHGGTIEAHSAGVGRGAEFVVRLPLADVVAIPELRPPVPRRDHDPLKVLIVDDNEDLVEMLSAIVTDLGHDVRKALDGGSALDAARSYHPDLVLLDLGLPVVSGIEVARELRNRPETADACLIAITGWGAPEDRARTKDAGFNHHLTKPVDPEQLIQVIAQCA